MIKIRISRGYRMTGIKIDNELILRTAGPHDEDLGKK